MTGADIAEFVAARLDEDEAAANATESPSPWKGADDESDNWIVTDATGEPVIYDEGTPTLNEAKHIARHDPARALREVEAKRKIMDEIFHYEALIDSERGCCCAASRIRNGECRSSPPDQIDGLRDLASIWSDHPDYRPGWAPAR